MAELAILVQMRRASRSNVLLAMAKERCLWCRCRLLLLFWLWLLLSTVVVVVVLCIGSEGGDMAQGEIGTTI